MSLSQVTSCDLEVQPLMVDRQILECFPVLLQREKLFVLLFKSVQNVGLLHRLDFQFLPKSAVRSFVQDIRGDGFTIWTVFCAWHIVVSLRLEKGMKAAARVANWTTLS